MNIYLIRVCVFFIFSVSIASLPHKKILRHRFDLELGVRLMPFYQILNDWTRPRAVTISSEVIQTTILNELKSNIAYRYRRPNAMKCLCAFRICPKMLAGTCKIHVYVHTHMQNMCWQVAKSYHCVYFVIWRGICSDVNLHHRKDAESGLLERVRERTTRQRRSPNRTAWFSDISTSPSNGMRLDSY